MLERLTLYGRLAQHHCRRTDRFVARAVKIRSPLGYVVVKRGIVGIKNTVAGKIADTSAQTIGVIEAQTRQRSRLGGEAGLEFEVGDSFTLRGVERDFVERI